MYFVKASTIDRGAFILKMLFAMLALVVISSEIVAERCQAMARRFPRFLRFVTSTQKRASCSHPITTLFAEIPLASITTSLVLA